MTSFYMDTSAIAKRYVVEVGTAWIRQLVDVQAGHAIIVCDLTPVEFVSILARQQRENKLSTGDVIRLETLYLRHHSQQYLSMALDAAVIARARGLLQRYDLRALDSLQLASAIEAAQSSGIVPVFVTGDKKLLVAAAGEGFTTDSPYNHP